MAATAILDFLKLQISVRRVVSVELHHHAKFRADQSYSCWDIVLLDFSRWQRPPSWIFKILNF